MGLMKVQVEEYAHINNTVLMGYTFNISAMHTYSDLFCSLWFYLSGAPVNIMCLVYLHKNDSACYCKTMM